MLYIKKEFRKGILFVRVKGSLDKDSIDKFKNEVTDLITDMKISNVVFNLSLLINIDFYGVESLLKGYNACKRLHGISMLCGINKDIQKYINKSRGKMYQIKDEMQALDLIKV